MLLSASLGSLPGKKPRYSVKQARLKLLRAKEKLEREEGDLGELLASPGPDDEASTSPVARRPRRDLSRRDWPGESVESRPSTTLSRSSASRSGGASLLRTSRAGAPTGRLYTWGDGRGGQLGHGDGDADGGADASRKAAVPSQKELQCARARRGRLLPLRDATVRHVACGLHHTLAVAWEPKAGAYDAPGDAIALTARLYAWGFGDGGRLGTGEVSGACRFPRAAGVTKGALADASFGRASDEPEVLEKPRPPAPPPAVDDAPSSDDEAAEFFAEALPPVAVATPGSSSRKRRPKTTGGGADPWRRAADDRAAPRGGRRRRAPPRRVSFEPAASFDGEADDPVAAFMGRAAAGASYVTAPADAEADDAGDDREADDAGDDEDAAPLDPVAAFMARSPRRRLQDLNMLVRAALGRERRLVDGVRAAALDGPPARDGEARPVEDAVAALRPRGHLRDVVQELDDARAHAERRERVEGRRDAVVARGEGERRARRRRPGPSPA
ncbi:hypothetical protein JL721_12250 [Aureococcus anophagefferens]|nr:hypothetical protein JL721_12250 [Aureococcus anophagefferens]